MHYYDSYFSVIMRHELLINTTHNTNNDLFF